MPPRSKRAAEPGSDGRGAESARQAEVLQLAAGLFARDGYAATTVRDIADAAGILSGSLYHHFRSKEAIADAVLRPFLDALLARYDEIAAAGEPARETFAALVSASLATLDDHREAAVVYLADGAQLAQSERFAYLVEAGERFERTWVAVVERGIAEGEFRRSLDARVTWRAIDAMLWSTARWYEPGSAPDAGEIAERYLSILLDGVVRGKKKKGKE